MLFNVVAIAQDNNEDKQFQLMKPILFEMNKKIFYKDEILPSKVNPNFIPIWSLPINRKHNKTYLKSAIIEPSVMLEEFTIQNKKVKFQNLKLNLKFIDDIKNDFKFKVEIVKNELTDYNNSKPLFTPIIFLNNIFVFDSFLFLYFFMLLFAAKVSR